MRFSWFALVLLLWSASAFGHNSYGYKGVGGWKHSDGYKGLLAFKYEDDGKEKESFSLHLEFFDGWEDESISATIDGGKVLDAEDNTEIGTFSCRYIDNYDINIGLNVCTSSFTDTKGRKITVVKAIDDDGDVQYFSGTITTADSKSLVWRSAGNPRLDDCHR